MTKLTTESTSEYNDLDKMSINDILSSINKEDGSVPLAIEKTIPQIEPAVEIITTKIREGGRLFYIGAGTSGRLGVVDASECPPTFGVPHGLVIGIIAGGDLAIRKAVENAEDNEQQAWLDLNQYNVSSKDVVLGIAASGGTPYVVKGLEKCQEENITTACITNNANSPVTKVSDFPIEVVVGPEFLTGSTRMKAGTAQKLVLNMISTAVMIKYGRVKGNKMVDMALSNNKLVDRGAKMVAEELAIPYEKALHLLGTYGSVRKAVSAYNKQL
jgi:N-acetylmuramic acid 6-phosphate etherase